MAAHRASFAAAQAAPQKVSKAQASQQPLGSDWHVVCLEEWHPLEISGARVRVRLRHDLLAPLARLAASRRVEEVAPVDLQQLQEQQEQDVLDWSVVADSFSSSSVRAVGAGKNKPQPGRRAVQVPSIISSIIACCGKRQPSSTRVMRSHYT